MAIVPYTGADTRGLVGDHANSEEWNAITKLADNVAAAPIGPGQPVARFAGNDRVCRAWTTGAALGVTRLMIDTDTTTGYPEGREVAIMTQGTMWVAAGAAATAGNPAGFNPATDRWANVGGSYVAVPGAEFDTTATANTLVRLRIQRPAAAVTA